MLQSDFTANPCGVRYSISPKIAVKRCYQMVRWRYSPGRQEHDRVHIDLFFPPRCASILLTENRIYHQKYTTTQPECGRSAPTTYHSQETGPESTLSAGFCCCYPDSRNFSRLVWPAAGQSDGNYWDCAVQRRCRGVAPIREQTMSNS